MTEAVETVGMVERGWDMVKVEGKATSVENQESD